MPTKLLIILILVIVPLHAEQWSRWSFNRQQQPSGRFFWLNNYNVNNLWPYYFPELVPTSTFTTTQLVTTTFINPVDAYCLSPPGLTNCITRQRRAVLLEENDFVYLKGQPIRPSEVSRMTMTEMPIMNVDTSEMLAPSIEIDEERVRDGRMFKKNNWFYATTQTVTLTVVTVVNSTMLPTLPIVIDGCIPNCLTSIPIC